MKDSARAALLALAACGLGACQLQRWPGPMRARVQPLPPGDVSQAVPGPQEVVAMRHADPVLVRRAGASGSFPLTFYSKRERLLSGGMMTVGPGGRGELLSSQDRTSIVMFDEGACLVGEPTRGEPDLILRYVTSARIELAAGARAELPGGAVLVAVNPVKNGPYLLESLGPEVLRLRNQSTRTAKLRFRGETIELQPGDLVDLAQLGPGTAPAPDEPDAVEHVAGTLRVATSGEVAPLEPDTAGAAGPTDGGPRAIHLAATGEGAASGLGVRVHLAAGDEATFLDLGGTARPPRRARPGPGSSFEGREVEPVRGPGPAPEIGTVQPEGGNADLEAGPADETAAPESPSDEVDAPEPEGTGATADEGAGDSSGDGPRQ